MMRCVGFSGGLARRSWDASIFDFTDEENTRIFKENVSRRARRGIRHLRGVVERTGRLAGSLSNQRVAPVAMNRG